MFFAKVGLTLSLYNINLYIDVTKAILIYERELHYLEVCLCVA